jgi:hypothetical protein
MRSLRRYAGGKRYKTVLTPEKKQEIGSRRKVPNFFLLIVLPQKNRECRIQIKGYQAIS